MPDPILERILAGYGCTEADIEPITDISGRSVVTVATVLKTEPSKLTFWAKETLFAYTGAEWAYIIHHVNDADKAALYTNLKIRETVAMLVVQKFLLINLKTADESSRISQFSPVSTTAEAVLSQMDAIVGKLSKHDPTKSLIPDLFDRIIKEALGIVKMLNLGLANDAYGSWRTLHEAECAIKLLIEGGEKIQSVYLKHIVYNNAFREAIPDVEATDHVFAQMKAEMKEHGLKSKDMKKYIEYGWLYSSPSFRADDTSYKLNFRDGVQKCAGLSKYSIWYEAASELSHSSPVFFYSSSEYFIELATIGLYDVIERVERLFYDYVEPLGLDSAENRENRRLLEAQLEQIASDRRIEFQHKYKDAQLYDEEDL